MHRTWGSKLYSTDYDLVEFCFIDNEPESVAYCEWKYVAAKPVDRSHIQITLMAKDATRLGLPAFFIRFTKVEPAFLLYALNLRGEEALGGYDCAVATERKMVSFLHNLRDEPPPNLHKYTDKEPDPGVWPDDNPPFIQ